MSANDRLRLLNVYSVVECYLSHAPLPFTIDDSNNSELNQLRARNLISLLYLSLSLNP